MRLMALMIVGLVACGAARAQDASLCAVPSYLLVADQELAKVAEALKQQRLAVTVVGSGSSLISGSDGPPSAYPARLERALATKLPGVTVKVTAVAKNRETAEDMAKSLEGVVAETRPDLVVWQTGTVDAIRGVQPDAFRTVLEEGVEKLHAKGADVILMNMQYSPRTESMIALGPYADVMRVVAQQYSVPLFDRLSIMRHWSEAGQFELSLASKSNVLAKKVHDCLGRAIATLIVEAAQLSSPQDPSKSTQ